MPTPGELSRDQRNGWKRQRQKQHEPLGNKGLDSSYRLVNIQMKMGNSYYVWRCKGKGTREKLILMQIFLRIMPMGFTSHFFKNWKCLLWKKHTNLSNYTKIIWSFHSFFFQELSEANSSPYLHKEKHYHQHFQDSYDKINEWMFKSVTIQYA